METLQHSLENARISENNDFALWMEEDYCLPPLDMEREAILYRYFEDITVEKVRSEYYRRQAASLEREVLNSKSLIRLITYYLLRPMAEDI